MSTCTCRPVGVEAIDHDEGPMADVVRVGAALARSGHDAGDLVPGPARYAVLLFALQAAFGVWARTPSRPAGGANPADPVNHPETPISPAV